MVSRNKENERLENRKSRTLVYLKTDLMEGITLISFK